MMIMKALFHSSKDERIQAEMNSIYRVGYFILTFGILFDILLQIAQGMPESVTTFRPVEFSVLLIANIICLIMMVRKGLGDDNQYAEAERFHHAHYLRISVLAALITALIFGALTAWRWWTSISIDNLALIVLITMGSVFLSTAPAIYALNYLVFRLAKKRRKQISQSEDEEK